MSHMAGGSLVCSWAWVTSKALLAPPPDSRQVGLAAKQSSVLIRSHSVYLHLVSCLLLVFNMGVVHHKEKIRGLWAHCPGVSSGQVKKTSLGYELNVCVRERGRERDWGGLGACKAQQTGPTHDAGITSRSLSTSTRPGPEAVSACSAPQTYEVSHVTFVVLSRKPSPTCPALYWGFGLAVAVNLAGFRLRRKSYSFR